MTCSSNRIVTCARCGRDRRHSARGLCATCYIWHLRDGSLDRFSVLKQTGYRRPRVDPAQVDEAVVLRIIGGAWRMRCSPSEKAEVCRRWVRSGRSLRQLETLTGWATHRYYRIRDDVRAVA